MNALAAAAAAAAGLSVAAVACSMGVSTILLLLVMYVPVVWRSSQTAAILSVRQKVFKFMLLLLLPLLLLLVVKVVSLVLAQVDRSIKQGVYRTGGVPATGDLQRHDTSRSWVLARSLVVFGTMYAYMPFQVVETLSLFSTLWNHPSFLARF